MSLPKDTDLLNKIKTKDTDQNLSEKIDNVTSEIFPDSNLKVNEDLRDIKEEDNFELSLVNEQDKEEQYMEVASLVPKNIFKKKPKPNEDGTTIKDLQDQQADILKTKVIAGDLGAKTGKGFYKFINNRPKKSKQFPKPSKDLSDRLIYSLLNESMSCLSDGIVDDTDLIDAAVIFGTGFAPFTGGPLNYAKSIGFESIINKLNSLEKSFGSNFHPSEGWGKLIT